MQRITALPLDHVFVFGSNDAGRHGRGAAQDAVRFFGARWGVGRGRTGRAYALATKDREMRSLPLEEIALQIPRLYAHARRHPRETFIVTPLGCGLAGYTPALIAPLFRCEPLPPNVILPQEFNQQ